MLKLLIQSYEMVIMNFWYSKHYGARVGDDFIAKKNKLKWNMEQYGAGVGDDFDVKITNSNI